MYRLSFISLLLIIGGSLTFVGSVSSQQFQLSLNISPLHIDGKYIKDASGNIIFLRGVNRGHFEDNPSGQWGGYGLYDHDDMVAELDAMANWGINVIRLYTSINFWIDNTLANTPNGTMPHREVIKDIVQYAEKKGIYIIYCPWCVSNATPEPLPFPPYTQHTDVIPSEQAFINYWVSVVTELGDFSNVIWEVWNEPHDGTPSSTMDDWYRVWQMVIDAIRATGDGHIIIIQWGYNTCYDPEWGPDLEYWILNYTFNDLTGNLLYSTHLYRYHGSFGAEKPYDYSTLYERMNSSNMKISWVMDQWNKPFIIGEIGANLAADKEQELEAFNNTLTILNEWDISYAAWEWWSGNVWELVHSVWNNPYPTESGQILIDAIEAGSTIRDIIPPIANAGPNQTANEDTLVTFNGSASWDNVGIINYTWTFTDRKPKILTGVNPTYTFETPSVYIVTLNVTDAAGNWDTDNITITVVDITPPVADAGPNQTVNEDTLVTFNGSNSYDNVGIINYTWTFKDITPKTLTGVKPTYNFTNPDNYTVTLNVTDAEGNWAIDTVVITVLDITLPMANAGLNQSLFQGMTVTFNGSGSTDNVGVVSYVWTFMDVTLQTLTGVNPNYTFNNVGDFEVTLNVTDVASNWNTDVTWVYVSPDTFKPFIDVPSHDPEIPDEYETVIVSVNVIDAESGIHSVVLLYSTDEDATWKNVTMNKAAGDTYKGEIPGFQAGTTVWYKIIAYDKANNSAVDDNAGEYYIYTVVPEFPTWLPLTFTLLVLSIIIVFVKKEMRNEKHQSKPIAEQVLERGITLPMHVQITDSDINRVLTGLSMGVKAFKKQSTNFLN